MTNTSGFWKGRAKKYHGLDWVNHQVYMDALIRAGNFHKTNIVLDVGTGPGTVANAIHPYVNIVIGLDKSSDMLSRGNWYGNMLFVKGSIMSHIFGDETFDRVVARHVFHHILRNTQAAMNECYRVLKRGGLMVFSEGVPPSLEVKQDYIEIFKLKEKRRTFADKDLIILMERAGFKNIHPDVIWLRKMSVRNWLVNSGLPKSRQDKIFDLHANSSDCFKRAYDMVEVGDDCLIDMKMVVVTGEKLT